MKSAIFYYFNVYFAFDPFINQANFVCFLLLKIQGERNMLFFVGILIFFPFFHLEFKGVKKMLTSQDLR